MPRKLNDTVKLSLLALIMGVFGAIIGTGLTTLTVPKANRQSDAEGTLHLQPY